MAPEVAREATYNQSVDVYSFGILLWELCSGEKPFYGYSSNKHMQNIVIGGERPPMDSQHKAYWPMNLQWLMNHCWSPHPILRPSFSVILEVLQDILDGKESIPASLCNQSLEKTNVNPAVEAPVGGFAGLFPMSRKKRHETTGNIGRASDDNKDGHTHDNNNVKSPTAKTNNGRSRSWGFVVKR
jgi:serine/threonine protein kinase